MAEKRCFNAKGASQGLRKQVGMPGDQYLVSFRRSFVSKRLSERWEKLKEVTWKKLDEKGEVQPGRYYLSGPFNGWNFVLLPSWEGSRLSN